MCGGGGVGGGYYSSLARNSGQLKQKKSQGLILSLNFVKA